MTPPNFKAIKLGWEPFGQDGLRADRELVRRARAVAGDRIELMIDAGGRPASTWPPAAAIWKPPPPAPS